MDLFGEHSVQVVTATLLEAALVLTLAALLVLLSVRVVQQSAIRPMLAIVPHHATRIASPDQSVDVPSARWLSNSLLTRAPPPDPESSSIDRRGDSGFSPSLFGDRFSG